MFKTIIAALLISVPAFSQQNKKIVLGTGNTVVIRGPISSDRATNAQLDLMSLALVRGTREYPIYLVLDSPGGSIIAGQSFIEFAKSIKNLNTISIFAASMASGIVEALSGSRYILGTGIMMFHRAQGGFQGYFETGEVESRLALFKQIVLNLEMTNAARLQVPIKEYKEKVAIEWWGFGQNAVDQKMADKVVDITCTPTLIKAEESVVESDGFFSRTSIYSKCPLFRSPISGSRGE